MTPFIATDAAPYDPHGRGQVDRSVFDSTGFATATRGAGVTVEFSRLDARSAIKQPNPWDVTVPPPRADIP